MKYLMQLTAMYRVNNREHQSLLFGQQDLNSQPKLLGYFPIFSPTQLWCTRFCAINNIGRQRRQVRRKNYKRSVEVSQLFCLAPQTALGPVCVVVFRLFGEQLMGISFFFLRVCVLSVQCPAFSSLRLSTILSLRWVPALSPSCMGVHRGLCRLFTVPYLTLIARLDS